MEIGQQILQPNFLKLEQGFKQLQREIHLQAIPAAQPLSAYLERKIRQMEVTTVVLFTEGAIAKVSQEDAQHQYRRLKLELRFARRKWQRIQTFQARFQRSAERKIHVAAFAA